MAAVFANDIWGKREVSDLSADFPICCLADFQMGRAAQFVHVLQSLKGTQAGSPAISRLEVCATRLQRLPTNLAPCLEPIPELYLVYKVYEKF